MLVRLSLKNFTVFKNVELAFTPGINVLIGANATGKTHAMKAAYALLRSARDFETKGPEDAKSISVPPDRVREKMAGVFRPEGGRVSRLVRRAQGKGKTNVSLEVSGGSLSCELNIFEGVHLKGRGNVTFPASIFLPAREVLSIYPGFIAAYQARELAFDETYYDLCVALSASPLRGQGGKEAAALWKPLGEHLRSKVELQKDSFYLTSEDGIIEAHLVAEGYRKVAALMHLITNGSLMKNVVLFWDEPETNLNPRLMRVVAEFLFRLAGNGVQIIIATHDYLLTNELSLNAEYQTGASKQAPIRFFSFSRGEDRSVSVQPGDTLADLADNPIMEEFEALYERERLLFSARDEDPVRQKR
jgi:energy-coupling factor transporter ATP-binding protein EcfA2